jgi:hypothetical protein
MKRIASLSILFAALIEFAIERAKFDLWIVIIPIVLLLWNPVGRALRITREKLTCGSPVASTVSLDTFNLFNTRYHPYLSSRPCVCSQLGVHSP